MLGCRAVSFSPENILKDVEISQFIQDFLRHAYKNH
jgi:hypothetical protein